MRLPTLIAGGLLAASVVGLAACGRSHVAAGPACPVSKETRAPPAVRDVAREFRPWAGEAAQTALTERPVYLLAASTSGAISRDGDQRLGRGMVHRAIVAIAPSYRSAVEIRGMRRVGSATLRFGVLDPRYVKHIRVNGNIVSEPKVANFLTTEVRETLKIGESRSGRWRIAEIAVLIGPRGCYELWASGPGLERKIVFLVPY
jgi:hypothetical protein